jgi:hypothetical protein
MLVMPWDVMPEERPGDLIGCYRIVGSSGDGVQAVEYERNGVHPADDVSGSWNRHLHFGDALHA